MPDARRQVKSRQVKMNVVYPHPPERVWRALTDPKTLARWLMPNDFKPRLGCRFRFQPRTRRDGPEPIHCEVVEIEAPRRLVYTWRPESDAAPSRVVWTLEPVEEGARLSLEHFGPEEAAGTVADAVAGAAADTDAAAVVAWAGRAETMRMQLDAGGRSGLLDLHSGRIKRGRLAPGRAFGRVELQAVRSKARAEAVCRRRRAGVGRCVC